MADETNTNIPRPIGIKPITLKPMTPPSATVIAPTPPAAPTAEATPAAGSVPSPTPPLSSAPAAPAPTEAPKISPISIDASKATGNKPLGSEYKTTTIRLKPVMPTHTGSPTVRSEAPTAPMKPIRPTTIQPPTIKPSAQPSPEAAAKAKTARIMLDAALGDVPSQGHTPSATAPLGKITSNITADISKAIKGQTSRVTLPQSTLNEAGQPRTLRIKPQSPSASPTPLPPSPAVTPAPESAPTVQASAIPASEAPTVQRKKTLTLKKDKMPSATPSEGTEAPAAKDDAPAISPIQAFQPAPKATKVNPLFIVAAFAAIFVITALIVLYMSQACGSDRCLTGFASYPNLTAPSWPGKVLSY